VPQLVDCMIDTTAGQGTALLYRAHSAAVAIKGVPCWWEGPAVDLPACVLAGRLLLLLGPDLSSCVPRCSPPPTPPQCLLTNNPKPQTRLCFLDIPTW
jgi:hypothetical protein